MDDTITWLAIPRFVGSYAAGDNGEVCSLTRTIDTAQGRRRIRWRVLKKAQDPYGYFVVTLHHGGRQYVERVHRLVAEAFHGPCPEGMEVRHGPAGMYDNRPSNLCWGTRQDNMLDKRRDGTHHMAQRETCQFGHLLEPPNCVAYFAKRGLRNCLACDRGRSTVRNAWVRHGVTLNLRTEADRHYRLIMGDAA